MMQVLQEFDNDKAQPIIEDVEEEDIGDEDDKPGHKNIPAPRGSKLL